MAFILLPTTVIVFSNENKILQTANIKLQTAFYIFATAIIILATAKIKLITAHNIISTANILLASTRKKVKQLATTQAKAHLQFPPPNAPPKNAKELFPFPQLKSCKEENFLTVSIRKRNN